MEYFYFPKYAGLPPSEQRRLRQERTDVCEQIMYHLIVWKGVAGTPPKSFDDYVADFRPYEPPYIPLLRSRGHETAIENAAPRMADVPHSSLTTARETCSAETQSSERLQEELAAAKDEASQLRAHAVRLTGEITRLHQHCATQTDAFGRMTTELHDIAAYNH